MSVDDGSGEAIDEALTGEAAAAFDSLPGGKGGWLHQLIIYAAKDPWQFCWSVLLLLSPLFCISAALSWKLANSIEQKEQDKQKKKKKQNNINKVKKGKSD